MGIDDATRLSVLTELATTISARKGADPQSSYTASLLEEGVKKCARKFGEESVELVVASLSGDKDHISAEAADVIYHLLVLLEATDISLDQVLDGLARRKGTSGHAEKASRTLSAP